MPDLLLGGVLLSDSDVVSDAVGEQEGILGHEADALPQALQVQALNGQVVDQDFSLLHLVQSRDQCCHRRLSTSGLAQDREALSLFYGETHPVKGLYLRVLIGVGHVPELYFALYRRRTVLIIPYVGCLLQEFVDPSLGDLCLLHDGGHPTDHGDGPGEHVHIDYELGNDPDVVDLSPDVLHAAHIDHQEVADPDQKDHQREEERLGLIEGDVPVLAGYGQVGEGSGGEGLYAVGLDHVDAREGLLGKGGESGEVLLHDVAALVDHPAQKIDRNRKHGQGQKGVERELGVDAGHVRDGHHKEHQHVHGVHDGRAKVHPYLANVLADPVHQVARSVALVEIQGETLVLSEDLVFQVKLDQARHDDEGLPHHEGEEA